ncbi:hypothetical protein QT19_00065, partial [Staphylococcus aureus]
SEPSGFERTGRPLRPTRVAGPERSNAAKDGDGCRGRASRAGARRCGSAVVAIAVGHRLAGHAAGRRRADRQLACPSQHVRATRRDAAAGRTIATARRNMDRAGRPGGCRADA